MARRRLLKLAVYVPPVILGMMVFGSEAKADKFHVSPLWPEKSHGAKHSCTPKVCSPASHGEHKHKEGHDE